MICLFFAYVRTKLEYCSLIRNPYCYSSLIEKPNHKFFVNRYLYFKIDHLYPDKNWFGFKVVVLLDNKALLLLLFMGFLQADVSGDQPEIVSVPQAGLQVPILW